MQTAVSPTGFLPKDVAPDSPLAIALSDRLPLAGLRFETTDGRSLFEQATLVALHDALPAVAELRLVQPSPAGAAIVTASIGGRHDFPGFVAKCTRVALLLADRLRSGARDDVAPTPPASAPVVSGGAAMRDRLRREDRWLTEQWACGITSRSIRAILAERSLGPVTWIEPDRAHDAYYADPFGWPGREDRILCERVPHASGIGELVWMDRTAPHAVHPLRPGAPTHRSYPLAWRHEGATYLMPESFTDRVSTIHRLHDDGRLEPWCTIGDGIAMSDATVFRAHDLWWIAYTDSDMGHHDNLCLMFADDLRGTWRQHPHNPVKIDIRASRCGGTIFEVDGTWYRPAQDCALRYGGALVLHRILELNPTRYREEPVAWLTPDPAGPYPHGLHTLSVWGDQVLVDGKRMKFRARSVLAKALRRLLGG